MGQFGTFYKGDKKKLKKGHLEQKAEMLSRKSNFVLPKVEIIRKGKDEKSI